MATTSSSQRQLTHTSNTYESNSNLTVTGDLTVNGSTTTINTATLNVEDKNVILGNVSSPSDTTADAGGITLKGASDYTILWNDATNSWIYNQGITVGENDTGHDVKFYGATSGRFLRWVESEDRLKLTDNTKLSLGGGNDLQLEFNGTHGYIKNNVGGSLYIQTANTIQLENSSGQDMLTASSGGAVKLFHGGNSTAKLETTANGVQVTGDILAYTASGQYFELDNSDNSLKLSDNVKLKIGTGSDLQLYHDGINSHIEQVGTGSLIISHNVDNADIRLQASTGSGTAVDYLILDSSQASIRMKRQTKWDNNILATFGDSDDLQIYHDGTHSYISNTQNEGNLIIENGANGHDILFKCDDGSGGLHEYVRLDGGLFHTIFSKSTQHADGAYGKFGNGGDLELLHDGTNSSIKNHTGDLVIEQNAEDKDIVFKSDNGSGGTETYFRLDGSVSSGNPFTVFPDSSNLTFGDSFDLRLFHNGTDSHIQNLTGDLRITNYANDKDIIFSSDDGSGGTEIYFFLDGSSSSGNPITIFPDNSYLQFGTSMDLGIVHNGTNALISNTTGNIKFTNYTDDADIIFECDDGSGGVTPYFRLDGDSGYTKAHKEIRMDDAIPLRIGTGGDARFMHDGNNTYLDNYTGDFYIRQATDDKDLIFQSDDGSGGLATYFYLDGSYGGTVFNRTATWTDNDRVELGTGSDLRLYHNGTNSYIENTTGDLYIQNSADDKRIRFVGDDGAGGIATYFELNSGQATHDGSATTMLQTSWGDNSRVTFGNSIDFQLWHDSTNSRIYTQTGDLKIQQAANDKDIIFECDDGSGGMETYFYLDGSVSTGNPYTIFPTNARCAWGNSSELQIFHTGTDSYVSNYTGNLYITNDANDKDIIFKCDDGSGGTTEYFYLDGSAGNILFGKELRLLDGVQIQLGTDNDMQVTHNGATGYVKNVTGDFRIEQRADDGDMEFYSDDGSGSIAKYFHLDGGDVKNVFSKGLRIPDGSVSDPALSFSSDTNSGIYWDNANKAIRFSTDGVQRGYFSAAGILSSGNVYTSSTGQFRNYGGTWWATTGVSGNGFQFSNTADNIIGMTLSSAGVMNVKKDIEILTDGDGLILNSPNGTRYKITVANDGSVTSTAL